jgi:hypothetical protein
MEKDRLVLSVGTVVQLSPESRFPGCFMLITEPKPWGAQGFISALPEKLGELGARAYYRAKWEEMEYVGAATWVPSS